MLNNASKNCLLNVCQFVFCIIVTLLISACGNTPTGISDSAGIVQAKATDTVAVDNNATPIDPASTDVKKALNGTSDSVDTAKAKATDSVSLDYNADQIDPTVAVSLDGKKEFEEHCASCHPKGGNIVNPKKTLSKFDLNANGIINWKDIVQKMRKPGPGMTPFDVKAVPDDVAKSIAQYILKTF